MQNCIGTHDGKFHCDEVLGCFMLRTLPEFKEASVIRSRDPEILQHCKVVLDVGGVYDPEKMRFDHHQRQFTETMRSLNALPYDTKLSSAGLVYKHFGRRVLAALLQIDSTESPILDKLYARMYENFVHSVDAIDNGIPQYDGTPRYKLASTLGSRVNSLNPAWNEEDVSPDIQFQKAMVIVGEEFTSQLKYLYNSWIPARELVENAVKKRLDHHDSGKILVLENGACPWKEHFFDIEKELSLEENGICYVCYPDSNSNWRIQAIPVDIYSAFENRAPLPEQWRGYRDQELSELANIEGCIFVHASGFIGGNKTQEGVLKMAGEALKLVENAKTSQNV